MKVILVAYINGSHKYLEETSKSLKDNLKDDNITICIIPTQGETKIECIYPVFIASEKIVKETEFKLEQINYMFLDLLQKINKDE